MKHTRNYVIFVLLVLLLKATGAHAGSAAGTGAEGVSIQTGIGIEWDFYQIINSTNAHALTPDDEGWLNGMWLQSLKSILFVRAGIRENVTLNLDYFGIVQFTTPFNPEESKVQQYIGGGGIEQISAQWDNSRLNSPFLGITMGYFPVNYTHSWQRLGSYLYRTGVYPGYIISTRAQQNVLGIAARGRVPELLTHTLLLTLETDQAPKHDVTLTYLGRIAAKGLQFDAAVMLHRLLRTDQGHYAYWQKSAPLIPIEDYTSEDWDESKGAYYRKAGIKCVGRISYDFKRLVASPKMGPNDLTLYAEAAVLGVRNFPGFYNKITQRIPVMAGIVVPTFKLLDVFGVEAEWYGSRWRNDPSAEAVPIPLETYTVNGEAFEFVEPGCAENQDGGKKARTNDWKWAVFAEKVIRGRIVVSLQFASDHLRAPNGNGYRYNELLHAPDEWYWQASIKTLF